jgi:hypothetical protein
MEKTLNTVYILHLGTWDSHHSHAVFTSIEKGEAYIKKFNLTDSPELKPFFLDPHQELVESDKKPYMASCKKTGKIKLTKKNLEYYQPGVHFSYATMYYYFPALNDEQALEMAEQKRQESLGLNWHHDSENP